MKDFVVENEGDFWNKVLDLLQSFFSNKPADNLILTVSPYSGNM